MKLIQRQIKRLGLVTVIGAWAALGAAGGLGFLILTQDTLPHPGAPYLFAFLAASGRAMLR